MHFESKKGKVIIGYSLSSFTNTQGVVPTTSLSLIILAFDFNN